jgi:diguanylate cyclase (GGDEF)-like protein
MQIFTWLERQPGNHILAWTLLATAGLGLIDYLSGFEIAFSVFYFLPIACAAFFAGPRAGTAVVIASAVAWLLADVLGGHTYSSTWVGVWNTMARVISFLVVAAVLTALRRAYEHEKQLARSDSLTEVWNRRYFFELLDVEIGRARRFRRPFTLLHFDIDGFKAVNDRFGHHEGDAVLRSVVEATGKSLRGSDVLARLGGDEFAVLLPETDADAARRVVAKLRGSLSDEMRKHEWPVSFSLGVLTCLDPPATPDEVVRLVDALTYAAKNSGKDTAVFDVVRARLVSLGQPESSAPDPSLPPPA